MARRGRNRDRTRREAVDPFARALLRPVVLPRPLSVPVLRRSLPGDRRLFEPARVRPAAAVVRGAARLVVFKPRSRVMSHRVSFAMPKKVALCVRRQRRREVLFAAGVGGARGRKRPPRRNEFSDVSCK